MHVNLLLIWLTQPSSSNIGFCGMRLSALWSWHVCLPSFWQGLNFTDAVHLLKRVILRDNTDTSLHVYWTGVLRIYNCDTCCKRWYFTFNGAECSGPLPIDGVVFMYKGSGKNLLRVRHIEGHCNNIHKGKVRVGFWVGNCPGYGNADVYTGWNSVSRIFIEEVSKPQA